MYDIIYLNGSLLPPSEARISPLDAGLLYGLGAFETMRSYGGCIFRVKQHVARLAQAIRLLGIEMPPQVDLMEAAHATLKANMLQDARVRITVSAGEVQSIPDLAGHRSPTVLILANALPHWAADKYEEGYSAIIATTRRNSFSATASIKSTNYLDSLLARHEARSAGADEAILLNSQGCIAEGSTSNLFVIRNGKLVTPREDGSLLPGVTRAVVMELARSLGVPVESRDVPPPDLQESEEAFLTNSTLEVMPLTRLNNRSIRDGRPGPITRRFMEAYRDLVRKEARAGEGSGSSR